MNDGNILFNEKEELFKEKTGKDFEFFYKKYYSKLIYYTTKMCKDEQKAEDISTDSFLIAFEKVDKYDKEKSQFSTWLFTIAKNLMLQEIKNDKKTMSIDVEIDEEGTTMKDFLQETESNEHINELVTKKSEIIKDQISKLKEPYKKVIEMREIQKMQYKDIAKALDTNLSTLKSRIRNGRHILISETQSEFEILDEMYL